MELHDNLYALGLRLGREVFDDPESFRGALDDFLDEDAATTGDINLLVDAVRLGAFRSMITMLDSGADVGRAIEEAGNRLSRDRGSADVAGSQWACAVLGFAVGKVSDPDVRRYRTQHPHSPAQHPPTPPTMLPPVPTAPPTQVPTPPTQSPQQPPQSSPPLTPQQQGSYSPQPPTPSWPAPPSAKKKRWPVVVAAVTVLAVIGGGVVAAVVVGGGDSNNTAGPKKSETTSPTYVGPDTEFDSVNGRYTSLAALVTTGVDECSAGTAAAGETEKLECTIAYGTLTLTTYDSAEQLKANRTRQVSLDRLGGRYLDDGDNVVYGFEDPDFADNPGRAGLAHNSLYWDSNESYQSAYYEGGDGVSLDTLVTTFESTTPAAKWPTKPTDPGLIEFASRVVPLKACERIQVLAEEETEENVCNAKGAITAYFGHWDNISALRKYRKARLDSAIADGRPLRTWNLGEGTPTIGALYEYETDSGDVQTVRYWDDPDCLCYGEAYLSPPDYGAVGKWWIG